MTKGSGKGKRAGKQACSPKTNKSKYYYTLIERYGRVGGYSDRHRGSL